MSEKLKAEIEKDLEDRLKHWMVANKDTYYGYEHEIQIMLIESLYLLIYYGLRED